MANAAAPNAAVMAVICTPTVVKTMTKTNTLDIILTNDPRNDINDSSSLRRCIPRTTKRVNRPDNHIPTDKIAIAVIRRNAKLSPACISDCSTACKFDGSNCSILILVWSITLSFA